MSNDTPITTRLLFVRHGQTNTTVDDAFCGSTEVPLTPIGHRQAQALAERLRHVHVDALYCSPQQRALETATPIASVLGLEMHKRDELREMDFGVWENHPPGELLKEYPQLIQGWNKGLWMGNPPGGETRQAVIARVVPCIIELLSAHAGKTLLVVSHRTTLRLLIGNMLDMALSSSRRMEVSPASLTELHVIEDQVRLIFFNDTSHLTTL